MSQNIYAEGCPQGRLTQGDILDPKRLTNTLSGHQQYFLEKDYFRRFLVVTQTCDLVPGRAAGFVFLAVVRHLEQALDHSDFHTRSARSRTEKLVSDLINYNYNKRGYFFLPAMPDAGIERDSVVDLRVMFSLRYKHYPELLEARLGSLTTLFAAKLGSMTGEMFSRVAVDSWNDGGYAISAREKVDTVMKECQDREQTKFDALCHKHGTTCGKCGAASATTYRWTVDPRSFENIHLLFCNQCAAAFDDALPPGASE